MTESTNPESNEVVGLSGPLRPSLDAQEEIMAAMDSEDDSHSARNEHSSSEDDSEDDSDMDEESDMESWQSDLIEELESALKYECQSPAERAEAEASMAQGNYAGRISVANDIKDRLNSVLFNEGPVQFIAEFLMPEEPEFSAAQVLAGLGFPLPSSTAARFTEQQLQIGIQMVLKHVMSNRRRLPMPRTIDDVVELIKKSKNILVLSGAGISTSLGIPDFRSSKGLYAQLEHLGLADPQDVFEIDTFRDDPRIFYSVAAKILPESSLYSPTHQFLKLLHENGKLLRNYTQNIDNLEAVAGLPESKIVQCHGSFGWARCFTCNERVKGSTLFDEIRAGKVPRCPKCTKKAEKLEIDSESYGVYKPEITFFGEQLPTRFHDLLLGPQGDAACCDLLICIGTSLKVAPVSDIVRLVRRDVPQIYISMTPASHLQFDVSLLGACDDVIELLCSKLQWPLNHEMAKRPPMLSESQYPGGIITYNGDGLYEFLGAPNKGEERAEHRAEEAAEAAVMQAVRDGLDL